MLAKLPSHARVEERLKKRYDAKIELLEQHIESLTQRIEALENKDGSNGKQLAGKSKASVRKNK